MSAVPRRSPPRTCTTSHSGPVEAFLDEHRRRSMAVDRLTRERPSVSWSRPAPRSWVSSSTRLRGEGVRRRSSSPSRRAGVERSGDARVGGGEAGPHQDPRHRRRDRPARRGRVLAVEARVLGRAPQQTLGAATRVVGAAVAADPAAAKVRREQAVSDRRVELWALPDGMAALYAVLPAPAAVTCHDWITALAEGAKGCGRRADPGPGPRRVLTDARVHRDRRSRPAAATRPPGPAAGRRRRDHPARPRRPAGRADAAGS